MSNVKCQMSNVMAYQCQISWHINVKCIYKAKSACRHWKYPLFFNVTLSIKGISEEMFYKVYTTYYELGCKVPLNVFSRDRGDKWLVALYLTLPRVAKCQFFYTEQNS